MSPPSLSGKGAGGLGEFESDLVLLSDSLNLYHSLSDFEREQNGKPPAAHVIIR